MATAKQPKQAAKPAAKRPARKKAARKPLPAMKEGRKLSTTIVVPPAEGPAPELLPNQAPELTTLEALFVREYLVDRNGTRAYMRVSPGVTPPSASSQATLILRRPHVLKAVEDGLRRIAERADLKAEDVVRRLCGMASADERELMELRVGCCRYCWGQGNRYQRTVAEMERAMEDHAAKLKADASVGDFDPKGGEGYNANHPPNPDCGECFGDGVTRPVFKDTRTLSEGAALLFAGIKVTKDGMELKTHSRADALVNLGRHFGLFTDKLKAEVKVDAVDELRQFLGARSSRLPIGASGNEGGGDGPN